MRLLPEGNAYSKMINHANAHNNTGKTLLLQGSAFMPWTHSLTLSPMLQLLFSPRRQFSARGGSGEADAGPSKKKKTAI